jgi:trehalose-phosphatase
VARELRRAPRLALILDYDGTLAPIRSNPSLASPPQEGPALLARMIRLPRVGLWIVSGRRAEDLAFLSNIPGLRILGNYGHRPLQRTRAVKRVYRQAVKLLSGMPGVSLEDKAVSFAIHYRAAPPAVARRARELLRELLSGGVQLLRGKQVWEIAPCSFGDKGQTVKRLLATQPSATLPVIAGDDIADEAAFEAAPGSLTVRVGWSRRTAARYFVRSPREMWQFLQRIERLRVESTSSPAVRGPK